MRSLLSSLSVLALFACNPAPSELERARETWAERGADDYTLTVQQLCFCPDNGPIVVEVVGGVAVSATQLPAESGEPVEVPIEDWFTVEGLFDLAEDAVHEADVVDIEFGELGQPSRIEIDWYTNAVDDEVTYVAEVAL